MQLILMLFESVCKWLYDSRVHLTILIYCKLLLLNYFHHVNPTAIFPILPCLIGLNMEDLFRTCLQADRESGTDGKVKEALMNRSERMELNKRRSARGKGELT